MGKLYQQHPDWAKSRFRRLALWALGRRCELWRPGTKRACGHRAVGKYCLAQEFGTVQADLCQPCLMRKLKEIAESEWGQYEAEQSNTGRFIRGTRHMVLETWSTELERYWPSWAGRVLMALRLDR